jgi:hypothetical protein
MISAKKPGLSAGLKVLVLRSIRHGEKTGIAEADQLECLQGHKETSLPSFRSLRISPRPLEDELGAIVGRSK